MLSMIHSVVSNLGTYVLKAALVALAAGPLAAGGCTFITAPTAKGAKSASTPHAAGSAITVDARNGSVEIIADASRSDVQINANFTCAGGTQQEADQRLAQASIDIARDTSRTLVVKPVFPGGPLSHDAAAFVIRVPDAVDLAVKTSHGRVVVTSSSSPSGAAFSGVLSIDTSNAPVTVTDFNGAAIVNSSNGSITIKTLGGELLAGTSNAPVNASDIAGKASIHTSNGSITLVLQPATAGPLVLDTSNAPINITVGAGFLGDVALSTSNGSIKVVGDGVQFDQSSKTAATVRRPGGEPSRATTSNGSITFTVAK